MLLYFVKSVVPRLEAVFGPLSSFSAKDRKKAFQITRRRNLHSSSIAVMGLGPSNAFSKDVLCIEIRGPGRPQL